MNATTHAATPTEEEAAGVAEPAIQPLTQLAVATLAHATQTFAAMMEMAKMTITATRIASSRSIKPSYKP
jgi:hypothetical protein